MASALPPLPPLPPPLPRLKDAVREALGRGDAATLHALDAQLAQWTSAMTVDSSDDDGTMTAHLLKLRALVLLKLEAYEFSRHALTLAANVLGGDANLWAALSVALTRLGDHAEAARAVTRAYAICHESRRRDGGDGGDGGDGSDRVDIMLRGCDPCAAV